MSRRVGFRHHLSFTGEPAEVRKEASDFGWQVDPSATREAFVTIDSGTFRTTRICADVWLMKHVHIGHDCVVHEGTEIAPHACIGGEVTIGPNAKIGMNATILPGRTIGQRARIGAGAVVTKDVPPGETWAGNPARRMPSSTEREPISQPILARRVISTSATTTTPASAPETPSPASAVEQAAEAWSELAATPAKPTTTPPAPPDAATATSAPSAAKPAHGTRPWTQVYPTRVDL